MNWLRPLGFVGLIVALIIVAMLTLRGSGPKPKGASAAANNTKVLSRCIGVFEDR